MSDDDRQLEAAILRLLPGRNAVIRPADVARAAGGYDWQALHERRAAWRRVAPGRLEIVQKRRIVDPSTAKGGLQLRRAR